jgi:hypothetical protein
LTPPRRQVELALIVASRFALLLGLAVWIGVALGTLLLVPVLFRKLARPQANELVGAVFARVDQVLLAALGVAALGLGSRVVLERAAPPSHMLLALGIMAGSRLVSTLAVGPALRAFLSRLRDANAPASDAERSAFSRLYGAALVLLAVELCLALYALFSVS